jgi:hypothetical protein
MFSSSRRVCVWGWKSASLAGARSAWSVRGSPPPRTPATGPASKGHGALGARVLTRPEDRYDC